MIRRASINFKIWRRLNEKEVQIPEIGKKADFTITNNGSKDDLSAKVEKIIETIQNSDKH